MRKRSQIAKTAVATMAEPTTDVKIIEYLALRKRNYYFSTNRLAYQDHQTQKWLIVSPAWRSCNPTQIFEVAPEFTIRLSGYSWCVHLDVLAKESRFFKAIKENRWDENISNSVTLHDDDPWAIGRLIQFCYVHSYDYTHAKVCYPPETCLSTNAPSTTRKDLSRALTLRCIMRHTKTHPRNAIEASKDARMEPAEIDFMMYAVADKYGVTEMRSRILETLDLRTMGLKVLVKVCSKSFRSYINEHAELKKCVAKAVNGCYSKLREHHNEWLQAWFATDISFAMMVLDKSHSVDYYVPIITGEEKRNWAIHWDKRPSSWVKLPSPPRSENFESCWASSKTGCDAACQTDIT